MTVYALGEHTPLVAASAYVAPTAAVIGKVILAKNASVWFGATIRGDNETITVGPGSNVQDLAVLHTDMGYPLMLGADVSIGHQAVMHGCTVGEGTLVGIQAIVMNGAVVGKGCLVGAGALITENKVFADGTLIVGAPARAIRELTPEERQTLLKAAAHYAERGAYYRTHLHAIMGESRAEENNQ